MSAMPGGMYEPRTPRLEITPMSESDLDAVARIEAEAYPFPWSRGNFADSIAVGYQAWILRSGGALAGYAVWMHIVDEAHLLNICIAPRHQKRGWGARLLRYVMFLAQAGGARAVFLEVRPSNEPALALYRRFRFRRIGMRKDYYPAAEGREHAFVMFRALGDVDEAGGAGELDEVKA